MSGGGKEQNYYINFFKDLWKGGLGGNKQKNYFLLALMVLGIILMFGSSHFSPRSKAPPSSYEPKIEEASLARDSYEKDLSNSLQHVLGQIDGISEVHVLISLENSEESYFAQVQEENTRQTTENDSEGGVREIFESNLKQDYVLLRDASGGEKPLLLSENMPRVSGVLIVARGVESSHLCLKVVRAIQSVLNLPAHRIAVLPLGNN